MANEKLTYPAISIIIPLYNVEKYIGECLDSILVQTFQDFEVIVVDDCSTDKSVAIVESYMPEFNGRLKLVHMEKNSGGAGMPRNKGMEIACGEYIFFMDSDDTITPTALNDIYAIAKNFDADIVHFDSFYYIPEAVWDNPEFRKNLKPHSYRQCYHVSKPTLITSDFAERANLFQQGKFIWSICCNFIRRDFIINSTIKFCNIFAEDMIFSMCMLCAANRYVVAPNVFYNYRIREGSTMNSKREIDLRLHRQIKSLKVGVKYLDEFLSVQKTFAQRPDLKYLLFDAFIQEMIKYLIEIYAKVPAYALDESLRKEFGDGDNTALLTFVFSMMNIYRLQLIKAQSENVRLESEFIRLKSQVEQIVRKLKQE